MSERCNWCETAGYAFNVNRACCRLRELCQLPRDALVAHAAGLETDADRDALRMAIVAERKRLKEVRAGRSNNLRVEALAAIRNGKA